MCKNVYEGHAWSPELISQKISEIISNTIRYAQGLLYLKLALRELGRPNKSPGEPVWSGSLNGLK